VKEKSGEKKDTKDKKDTKEEKKEEEPPFEMIKNPSRAIPPQLKVISMPEDSRYVPLKPVSKTFAYFLSFTKYYEVSPKLLFYFGKII